MDYVAMLSFRQSVTAAESDAALARRASWRYPDAVRVIAEYWPMSDSQQVVSIFSTDDVEAVMEIVFEWRDAFDVAVYPAVSAEQGLAIGPGVMSRLSRLSHQR